MLWLILFLVCFFLFLLGMVYYYILSRKIASELRHRFEGWAEEEPHQTDLQKRAFLKPILGFLSVLSPLNALIPLVGLRRMISKRLIVGNVPLTVNEFLALKEISAVLFWLLFWLITGKLPSLETSLIIAFVGFFAPDFWLNSRINARKEEIAKELPNVIDLLTLCVDAGMDFMLAVKRVVRDYKPCAVTEELANVWRQIQMGRSRSEALKMFAWRTDMPEVASFVRALIQGDRMGTPIGEILKMQAEEMRSYRVMQAEEIAMKAPVKMLFPLLFLIMPVILIVVAGPVLLTFVKGDLFGGMGAP